jgi:hypothetical protein
MNERIRGHGTAMFFAIATLGVTLEIEGCSSSSSKSDSSKSDSSTSDECPAACAKGEGKPGCNTAGIDGGPDCLTACRNPNVAVVPSSCNSTYQAYIRCIATTGTVTSCNAMTNVPTVTGCDNEFSAGLQCFLNTLDAGVTD